MNAKMTVFLAMFLAFILVISLTLAMKKDYTGTYSITNCRYKHFEGSGQLSITSVEKPYGFSGYVIVRSGKITKYSNARVWYNPYGHYWGVWLNGNGSSVKINGHVDAKVIGMWPEATMHGNFDITSGPRGCYIE